MMDTTVDAMRRDFSQSARRLGRWVGLRGLFTLALGILFLARPGTGVGVLMACFAIYCFVDGFAALAVAIGGTVVRSRAAFALEGIVSILAGILTFAMPGNVAVVLLYLIAVRALIIGGLEVIAAFRLGQAIPNPWLLALGGLASVLFGILLVRNPQAGILSITWLVGIYAVVLGIAQLAAAISLRSAVRRAPPVGPTVAQT
jgi:uncharacterized membrane protein HdeD (DUF308 family)